MNKIHLLLDSFLGLIKRYVLELIILMFISLFSLWSFAFLANGLYGCNFDLASCWGGFSAIGGAGVLAAVKYCTDSWKNSPQGYMPGDGPMSDFDKDGDGKVSFTELAEIFTKKAKQFAEEKDERDD